MKNIIFLTFLNLWSMDKNKGAPSFYKTVDAYLSSGWNVTLINPKYDDGVTPKISGLNQVTFKSNFYPLVKIKKIGFLGRIFHNIYGNYILCKLGEKILKKYNYKACIYSYEVNSVYAGGKLARKYNLPFVTRFQGTILAPIKDNLFNRLRRYPHFQALRTKANVTIMTDDGTKGNVVLKRLKNDSEIVRFWRNGVDIKLEAPKNIAEMEEIKQHLGINQNEKVLLTVSRLVGWKRVDRAIEALAVVVKEKPNVKLVVVGDGEEKQNLVTLVKKLNITKNVLFIGAVPQTEVKNYLDLADVFLSLYDLSNVGNPLLEAMSRGKPIITLNVGDTASLIKNNENGVILELSQLDEIPRYVHKIIDNNEYAKMLGNNAKRYAKDHFWSWQDRMKAELALVGNLYDSWNFSNERNIISIRSNESEAVTSRRCR